MFRTKSRDAALTRQLARQGRQGRRLSLESMEERRLMAADAYLAVIDGVDTLVVDGTNSRDVVRFEDAGFNLIRVSVKDQWGKLQRNDANQEVLRTFNRNDFERIKVNALGGADDVFNTTNVPMTADGGSGNDYLSGGSGADHLLGGWGEDKLLGNNGDDLLEGGGNTDWLYGGNHNDTLYGDDGDDWLYGQGHNDGLFGGNGRDRMYAGSGFDRVLRDEGVSDYVYNTSADDAIIWFKSGSQTSRTNEDGVFQTFNGKSWGQSEIKAVDEALALLQETTGNTRLLKDYTGSAVTFFRVGTPNTGNSAEGWSNHMGQITITDSAFDPDMPLTQTVVHEIGHNWDWEAANNTIDDFRALSGWTDNNILTSTWIRGGGRSITINPNLNTGRDTTDTWWYDPAATNFVREYGRTDPYEDFATSFAAYILGDDYYVDSVAVGQTVGGAAAAPEKMAYMAQFVGSF